MRVIFDARALDLYKGWASGSFHGGTEGMVKRLASGLAAKGHTVHVVTPDLPEEEQRGEHEWWWGPENHPTHADAVVMVPSIEMIEPYSADHLIVATNGLGHALGNPEMVDAFPVFSQCHAELLHKTQGVPLEKCHITGLGIDLDAYPPFIEGVAASGRHALPFYKQPGRLLYANDPQRGLWHVLDVFDALKLEVPDATLHVAYDFDRQFEAHRWAATALAEELWECRRRMMMTPGVHSLGNLSAENLIREQLECQVHVMPSDPPNLGSQIHGLTQMECAAAGAALVLSDTEAFPEVFGEAAEILPLPGTFLPPLDRRFDAKDWALNVAAIMSDAERWDTMSRASRALAEQHTWSAVIDRWDALLVRLGEGAIAYA